MAADRVCPHDRVVLVEGGYEREWGWDAGDPKAGVLPTATDYGLESFSDDGDGVYRLRCKWCLADLGYPPDLGDESWEWQ